MKRDIDIKWLVVSL